MDENKKSSILVVDDTPANIDILMEILDDDYDVAVAIDGASTLEYVEESTPDLILLDIMMPGIDGYEVCSRLKQGEETKDIPVIFITAMNEVKDEVKGFDLGAVDYITKPFSPPVVLKRVETALLLEQKNRELAGLAKKLSKYLSPQVYVSIFRGEQDAAIHSKRKKLTIFFSDIVNFTSTTEGMEAEDLTDLLNSYLDEMSTIALKYGGTIDKFIGDAILIFFGDPLSNGLEEDAHACVSMAIEMRERLEELQKKWYSFGIQNPFRVRAGIATGYCTVGNFGSKNRMDYTIIGSQVNLASRLESNAQPGQILISHETWSLVNKKIRCLKDGMIKVKGISHVVQTYQVDNHIHSDTIVAEESTAGQISEDIQSLDINETIEDTVIVLDKMKPGDYLVVTENEIPQGILTKSLLSEQLSDSMTSKVLFNKSLAHTQLKSIVSVDCNWPLTQVINRFALNKELEMYEPVIVTDNGKLHGVIPAYKLIRYIIEK